MAGFTNPRISIAQNLYVVPAAWHLYDSAMNIYHPKPDSSNAVKAILLLNQAISIDTNCDIAIRSRMHLCRTVNNWPLGLESAFLLRKKYPMETDILLTIGHFYDWNHDPINAQQFYKKALVEYSKTLDKNKIKNDIINEMELERAICMIMMGDSKKGQKKMNETYNAIIDGTMKFRVEKYLNKSRNQLLQIMLVAKYN